MSPSSPRCKIRPKTSCHPAAVLHPGGAADDRIHPNHDGPGRRRPEAGAVCDQIPTSTPVSPTCARTVTLSLCGFGRSTSPMQTSTTSPPTSHPTSPGRHIRQRSTDDACPGTPRLRRRGSPVLPGVPAGIDSTDVVVQMVRRAASPGFESWWKKAENVGFCANPIHLLGTDTFGRAHQVLSRCNNRRAVACPSCSICMPATPGSSCTPACTADTTTCRPPSPSTRRCSSP